MKKIIVMSGLSGAGKTYERTHNPELKDLPQLDIMDIYHKYPHISWQRALSGFMDEVQALINQHDIIVVEAFFKENSRQRQMVEWIAEGVGATVEYRVLNTPIEVCRERIISQGKELAAAGSYDPFWQDYTDVRLKLLDMETA